MPVLDPDRVPISACSGPRPFAGLRTVLVDASVFGLSRRALIGDIGLPATKRFTLRLGYAQGWQLAAALPAQDRPGIRHALPRVIHGLLGLVGLADTVQRHVDTRDATVIVNVTASCEGEQCGPAAAPVCWFTSGVLSGYLSRALGVAVVCREEECIGVGHPHCRFRIEISAESAPDLDTPDLSIDTACAHVLGALVDGIAPEAEAADADNTHADHDAAPGMQSQRMRGVLRLARRAAAVQSTVLITGESGVGKERLARLIHDRSPRGRRAFVAVNCGALPETLIDSELFGHRRGAFTGAHDDRAGLFEAAHGGTIFLDEIGELRPDMQIKLLRVLQEREIRRLGENRPRPVDVRVIVATNRDLQADVVTARFRQDLYYRLAVLPCHIPPLRDRDGDLAALIDLFVNAARHRLRRPALNLTRRARTLLLTYHWPGNIRELENAIEAASALAADDQIDVSDLPDHLRTPARLATATADPLRPLWEVERDYILSVLRRTHGNRTLAATVLAIGTKTLYRKLLQYQRHDRTPRSVGQSD